MYLRLVSFGYIYLRSFKVVPGIRRKLRGRFSKYSFLPIRPDDFQNRPELELEIATSRYDLTNRPQQRWGARHN